MAKDAEDYVRIAVTLGTDKTEQARVRKLIKANSKKLFYRSEAVRAWTNLLKDMAYNNTKLGDRMEPNEYTSRSTDSELDQDESSTGAKSTEKKIAVLKGDARLDWEDALATAGHPKNSKVHKDDVLACKFVAVPLADGEVKPAEIQRVWTAAIGRKALIGEEEFGLFWHAFDALFDEDEGDDFGERNSNEF